MKSTFPSPNERQLLQLRVLRVGIAVIQIVTGGNREGQFKVCGTCLKEYIDQEGVKK
ncbi:MAG: hypothetical protein WBZ36_00920 [Candidatus Nitrosopolaris sp.]